MVYLTLPAVAEGTNPYLLWALWLRRVFESAPTPGFHARLYILWALAGYGMVAATLYLIALFLESRVRDNSFWFWRFIYRPNGRYLVGNQRTLFALFSLLSCGIFVGYFLSFDSFHSREEARAAFFWRSIIWLPIGIHLWVSSWANLQATIITSQTAVGRQILGPILATTLYLAGIVLGTLSITGLAVACSVCWTRTWNAQERFEEALLALASFSGNDSPQVAQGKVEPFLVMLNSRLRPFIIVLQVDNALCAAGAALIIVVNFAGFALVHALHRQIKFHIIEAITESQTAGRRQSPSMAVAVDREADEEHNPPWRNREASAAQEGRAIRRTGSDPVAQPSQRRDMPPIRADLPSEALRRLALDGSPLNSAARHKAMRLLELRKAERDVLALLVAIVLMASMCLGIALWIAISPTSVYEDWTTIEVAYFLVPWMYLCSVGVALTFLLVNTSRHLVPVHRNANLNTERHVLPVQQPAAQPSAVNSNSSPRPDGADRVERAEGGERRTSLGSGSTDVQTSASDDLILCLSQTSKA
ncbi:hypothetical protein JCM3774_002057 [Rhodotorula dairenensis]